MQSLDWLIDWLILIQKQSKWKIISKQVQYKFDTSLKIAGFSSVLIIP